ncbi:LysM peptidoglycan-binding domain-containing protein [Oleiagrimonas sp. MCCC 1A03011]|uniref:LysM peptidoglycan-binding domain-containing protein n=1 Tax=Oleiagrimonas sp. MCCC 1A03011 TaxID=1926883 RepID=UPI001F0CC3F7|nr:LysM peptidoglycan-binding domain-containing protein [Oleiagrimonas sp. MCCC 1A03011]
MNTRLRLSAACVLLSLLAACSTQAPRPSLPSPSPRPAPATSTAESPTRAPETLTPAAPPTLWSHMRGRFAMPGCDADPQILVWAHRFTRHPHRFERYLKSVTPTIAYIDQAASKAGVPAEFSLLPWVESRYRAYPPRGGRPAGMWQIMPITARAMGLPIKRDYDGRLDRTRTPAAVMKLLYGYGQRWQDWRLVDMAYNAGEYRIRRLHSAGPAPAEPVIPDLAVTRTTREHLTKLLAIACVIREPQRFHVQLPDLPAAQQLRVVMLTGPTLLKDVAHASGTPLKRVRALNAAYLHGRMPINGPWRVLLPATAAQRLRHAVADGRVPRQPTTYTVMAGDSLWKIAHRHGVSIHRLRELNHLHGGILRPGQVLMIDRTN